MEVRGRRKYLDKCPMIAIYLSRQRLRGLRGRDGRSSILIAGCERRIDRRLGHCQGAQ